jgi:hypothetical protein
MRRQGGLRQPDAAPRHDVQRPDHGVRRRFLGQETYRAGINGAAYQVGVRLARDDDHPGLRQHFTQLGDQRHAKGLAAQVPVQQHEFVGHVRGPSQGVGATACTVHLPRVAGGLQQQAQAGTEQQMVVNDQGVHKFCTLSPLPPPGAPTLPPAQAPQKRGGAAPLAQRGQERAPAVPG